MTANKRNIESDLVKVDAQVNGPADYEDIPELDDSYFERAVPHVGGVQVRGRPPLGEKSKRQVTLRLDPYVLEHFRAGGAGWQSRINDVLRRVVDEAARIDAK